MSLRSMQELFGDLTLGVVSADDLAVLSTAGQAHELGYELEDDEIRLLRAIDWDVARRGLDAHRRIGETLAKAQYVRVAERYVGAKYPFPTPPLDVEVTMSDQSKPDQGKSELGNLEQPVRYPPPQEEAYQAAAVRCAPAVDPSMYQAAAVRCAPAVDPSMYQAAAGAAPAVDPSMYQAAAVRCAPAVDPSMYQAAAVRCAPAVDPSMYQAAAVRCAPAIDPSLYANPAYAPTVRFRGAMLRGMNFKGEDLRGADFTGADLTEADLSGADLRGAFFDGAILGGAKTEGARWK